MSKSVKKTTKKAAETDGDGIEARMREIWDEAASITEMAVGCIITNRNRTKRKDGSVHVSKEHYTFEYRGVDGARKFKRIPAGAVGRLRDLVKNGRRFMEIEAEYAALATELALSGKKKRMPRRPPRPEMANVGEPVGKLEKEAAGGGVLARAEDVDRMLAKAASEDMASFFALLVESFLLRR